MIYSFVWVLFSLPSLPCLFLTLETLDTSSCSYQRNRSDLLSLGFRKFAFFHFLFIVCPRLLLLFFFFFPFLRFTIRLLMVFRCCIDSLRGSLSVSAWITLCLAVSLRGYLYVGGACRPNMHIEEQITLFFFSSLTSMKEIRFSVVSEWRSTASTSVVLCVLQSLCRRRMVEGEAAVINASSRRL